jgi:hypothetical protein
MRTNDTIHAYKSYQDAHSKYLVQVVENQGITFIGLIRYNLHFLYAQKSWKPFARCELALTATRFFV